MSLIKITDITPRYPGYDEYPLDSDGKIVLPTVEHNLNGRTIQVVVIYRKNTVDYGNGLIGLCDSSKVSGESWINLRRCFIMEEADGTRNFHWCIGGSDTGACAGVSPYGNARTLYDDKHLGKLKALDNHTDYLFRFGHLVEELIATGFGTMYVKRVVKNSTVFWREDIGFMQANVDFLVDGCDEMGKEGWYVLEIKSSNAQSKAWRDFFKATPPSVPPYYITQAQHYCFVLSAAFNIKGYYFAAACDNAYENIVGIRFERNIEAEKKLLQQESDLESYLRFQCPPPLAEGNIKGDALKNHFDNLSPQAEKGKSVKLSDTSVNALKTWQDLQAERKRKKQELDELDEQIKALQTVCIAELGDCEFSEPFSFDESFETIQQVFYSNASRVTIDAKVLKDKYPQAYNAAKRETFYRKFQVKKVKK